MRATLDQYLLMTPAERRRVTEITDSKEPRRNPRLDDDEEYEGEARDRGMR